MKCTLGKIVMPGGAGLLGQVLAEWFQPRGWEVVVLTRNPPSACVQRTQSQPRKIVWDGCTLGPWCAELEGATAVINLAGRSVDCRYTRKNRREIYDSRIESTRVLGTAIGQCASPPAIWLNAGTATIYKHSIDRAMDEATGTIEATPEAKDAFSVKVATAWEETLGAALTPRTRKISMRTAMVFSADHPGIFSILRRLVRVGLGGKMGPGTQYVSWIHEEDYCRSVEFLLSRPEMAGAVNIAAPTPLTNADFMREFRHACHRSIGLPTPRLLLEIGTFLLRTESELVLKSRRVIPARLVSAGFRFRYPTIGAALAELEIRACQTRNSEVRLLHQTKHTRIPM